jgi:HlyD family secretion protein
MQVKKAETNLKRAQVSQEETAKAGFYSIAKSRSLLDQAKQALADTLLQMREAKNELAQTEITAPAQGMVVLREEYRSSQKRKPRVGDILVRNQPLIDLPDLSSMIIKTRVREVDLFKIEVGKKSTVEIDAYPQLAFTGTVSSIGVLALADMGRLSEEKYFEVRIALDESDTRLRPGMTTRAIIQAQEANHVLTIPLHSVFNDRKQNYCYIFHPQYGYEKREVVLGLSNDQWVEVKAGLQEGECVCLLNPFHAW